MLPVPVIVIVCLTFLMLAFFVRRPAVQAWRLPGPDVNEWHRIGDRIQEIHRDEVDDDFQCSERTRQALTLVLGADRGYGKLSAVPQALDHLQDPADFKARLYRSAGAQSIVIGLFGTVLTFCWVFFEQILSRSDGAPLNPGMILQHLGPIYLINAAALLSAIVCFHAGLKAKQRGEDVSLAASQAFHRLHESAGANLAPELGAALGRTADQFKGFSEQLFNDQFRKIESLMGEIQGLGGSLRELVRQVISRTADERSALEALTRQNAAAIEALTQRLDAGFQLLAQPFLQGIPSMEALTKASEALNKTAEEVAHANIVQLTTRLDLAVTRLDRVLDDLPARVSAGINQSASAIRAATLEGARAGVESSLAPVTSDIRGLAAGLSERVKDATTMVAHLVQARSMADDHLRSHLEAAVVEPLLKGLKVLSESIATLDAEARRLVTLDTPQLQAVQHTLDVMADRLAESLPQGGQSAMEQVREILLAIQSGLAGVRTEASSPNRTGWWRR